MASIEKLIHKQTQTMNSIARALPNYKKLGHAKMTAAVTQNRITLVQGQFAMVQDLDAEIHTVADEKLLATHPYFAEQQFTACESVFQETLDFMYEVIAASDTSTRIVSPTGQPVFKSSSRAVSHLPQLELPTFDGTVEQ